MVFKNIGFKPFFRGVIKNIDGKNAPWQSTVFLIQSNKPHYYCGFTLPIWDWYNFKSIFNFFKIVFHLTNMGLIHSTRYLISFNPIFHIMKTMFHLTNMGLILYVLHIRYIQIWEFHLTNMGLIHDEVIALKANAVGVNVSPYQYGIDTLRLFVFNA